ncbi:hypothetical protein [Vulcanococcus limneticus]|uniref:hypothetical protein n=1 Tax=Vulcanococcus limneticus TaxID=2170428 RepID=UPI0018E2D082|nr:hypothetical protein [Vulcanococcus limneticus]
MPQPALVYRRRRRQAGTPANPAEGSAMQVARNLGGTDRLLRTSTAAPLKLSTRR